MFVVAALGLLLASWLALFAVAVAGRRSRQSMTRRAKLIVMPTAKSVAASLPGAQARDAGPQVNRWLRRFFSVGLPRDWGMKSGGVRAVTIGFVASAGAWAVCGLALRLPLYVIIPIVCLAFLGIPRMLLKHEQAKAEHLLQDTFPDAVDMVVRMLRAGLPISSTVEAVAKEGPYPVADVFREIGDQIKIGIPINDALFAAGDRIGLADFRFFGVAVALQQSTGGNLAATLETLAEIMRKRRAMRLKGRATTGEARISAYILGGLPFLIIGILLLVDPAYLAPLIKDSRGNVIAGLALSGLVLGFTSMRRMMRQLEK